MHPQHRPIKLFITVLVAILLYQSPVVCLSFIFVRLSIELIQDFYPNTFNMTEILHNVETV